MEPNSTDAFEEMREESSIPGFPNAECDLLNDLLGDLVEGHISKADEGAPQRKEGCESMKGEGHGDGVPDGTPMDAIGDAKPELTKTQYMHTSLVTSLNRAFC